MHGHGISSVYLDLLWFPSLVFYRVSHRDPAPFLGKYIPQDFLVLFSTVLFLNFKFPLFTIEIQKSNELLHMELVVSCSCAELTCEVITNPGRQRSTVITALFCSLHALFPYVSPCFLPCLVLIEHFM